MKKKILTKVITAVMMLTLVAAAFAVVSFAEENPASVKSSGQVSMGENIVFSVNLDCDGVGAIAVVPVFDDQVFELKSGNWVVANRNEAMTKFDVEGNNALTLLDGTHDVKGTILTFTLNAREGVAKGDYQVSAVVRVNIDRVTTELTVTPSLVKIGCAADEHRWGTPDEAGDSLCSECGMTISYEEHSFTKKIISDVYKHSGATCDNGAFYYYACVNCGMKGRTTYEHGEPLGHKGGVATCTEKAICTYCNQEYGDYLHTFDRLVESEEFIADEGSCESAPTYYKSCACGAKGEVTFVGQGVGAHQYVDIVSDVYLKSPASCTAKATYYLSCIVCGAKGEESFEVGELTDHNYNNGWKNNGGGHWQECVCGVKTEWIFHEWNEGVITKDATSDSEGEKTFTCKVCGYEMVERLYKLSDGRADIYLTVLVCIVVLLICGAIIFGILFRKTKTDEDEKKDDEKDSDEDEGSDKDEESCEDSTEDEKSK